MSAEAADTTVFCKTVTLPLILSVFRLKSHVLIATRREMGGGVHLFEYPQLWVPVWSSHVFLLVIVLLQGFSSTPNLIRFHLCCSAEHWNWKFGSHPTPCLLFVNNFYKGLEKRKKFWQETSAVQTKGGENTERRSDGMKIPWDGWLKVGE